MTVSEEKIELKREILKQFLEKGFQITPDALNSILSNHEKDMSQFMLDFFEKLNKLPEKPIVITEELLNQHLTSSSQIESKDEELTEQEVVLETVRTTGKPKSKPMALEVEPEIKIKKDPSGKSTTTGVIEDFIKLFHSRFKKIEKMFLNRIDTRNTIPISGISSINRQKAFKTIGIVSSKRYTKQGNLILVIEDLESSVNVIIPSEDQNITRKGERILLDQVICVEGRALQSKNMVIAKDLIWPDLPMRPPNMAEIPISAAFISDIHVGSKEFLDKSFDKFISWLHADNEKQRELAGSIKYLIFAGDLVDGIGVYPRQEEDLIINNIYEQYSVISKFFEKVPDWIQVFIIPGNHDAVRNHLPQPAVPREFTETLYELPNVRMLGNPSLIEIHGINVLIHHGRSLLDAISHIPGLEMNKSADAMVELLRCRHVAPIWGDNTPISPEIEDFLVIDEIPDIYHCGHLHINAAGNYRGVKIINSGCFQEQTEYQRSQNINPTPGLVPIVNLQSQKLTLMDFYHT